MQAQKDELARQKKEEEDRLEATSHESLCGPACICPLHSTHPGTRLVPVPQALRLVHLEEALRQGAGPE